MPIETNSPYMPSHALPIYAKIQDPRINEMTVGEIYDIRYEDEGGNSPVRESNCFNYAHKAMLISKTEMEFGDVPPLLMAFVGHSRDGEEAMRRICPGNQQYADDRVIEILIFLRVDKAKEFVMGETEPLEPPFTKEDAEQ